MSKLESKNMNLNEIVYKLTGPIDPVGETNYDDKAFKNLEEHAKLTEGLVTDLIDNYQENKDAYQFSIKRSSDRSKEYLKDIYMELKEIFEEGEEIV